MDLARARVLGVNANGAIAVSRGERHETYVTGNVLDSSKSQLRELDPEVQKRLYQVARAKKILYLTTGHGERAALNSDLSDPRGTVRAFQDLLRAQNDEVRQLGAAQGLATEVPRDASAVLVLGPTTPFLRRRWRRWAAGFAAEGGSWWRSTPSPALSSMRCFSRSACASSPPRW